ncbi:MAG: hypothetical protein HN509_10310 [Halobacteriovoraceae bacterium]|nr:hypothetical protein [Halobacteriovoraceae bacterium]
MKKMLLITLLMLGSFSVFAVEKSDPKQDCLTFDGKVEQLPTGTQTGTEGTPGTGKGADDKGTGTPVVPGTP